MIIKRKLYSGVGTQTIYKTISPFIKDKAKARRAAIKIKQPLEKVGHKFADRYAIAGAIAGPAFPVPVASWIAGGTYLVSPKAVKSVLPKKGKELLTKVEQSKAIKTAAEPVHKLTDRLFKIGRRR